MYDIVTKDTFEFRLNCLPFEKRYARLFHATINQKNIVYFKNEFDNSTFRYRCYNICQALENDTDYVITYFLTAEIKEILHLLNKCDLVIFQRTSWCFEVTNIIFLLEKYNIPYLYDIDDLLYDIKYVPDYINSVKSNGIKHINASPEIFAHAARYQLICQQCKGYITTNEYLANLLKRDYNKPIWVIQNALNNEQETISDKINTIKKKLQSSDKFLLGYFSGSPSHLLDFSELADDLSLLMDAYPNIYLKIVGFMQLPKALIKHTKKIIFKPLVPYQKLQYEIAEVDLNLIPLCKSEFTNCKSELKYFEAAIVNVPSIATDTYIYKKIITDGYNGFLVDGSNWFNKLEYIYLNRNTVLDSIQKNGYEHATNSYSVKNQVDEIKNIFGSIFNFYEKEL